ncbi:MAG: UDP-3-O-(3-hydroxymyristoyl)glucosamine N-acyltransferase [Bacteroidales bacterium]|nr:UDP-3-O-(3-hydroxymyristoyl)glucosamine N-acyltransferase [Bacteroidales bacterium]
MKQYFLSEIENLLVNCQIIGNKSNIYFTNFNSLEKANEFSLVWIKSTKKNKNEIIKSSHAKIFIVDNKVEIEENLIHVKCFIKTENPKLTFLRIANFLLNKQLVWGIHPTAIIHPNAKIHPNTAIGAFTYVGEAVIGENTVIYGNCYVYNNVEIGKNCKIHAGAIIGKDGFGYEKNEKGEWESFPQLGKTVIKNNVDIGSNVLIHKGALSDTIIYDGVKIDDGTIIAHNVIIGKNSLITGHVCIAGSTVIGENCWIGPGVKILNQLNIEDNVFIGIGSVVIKNIKKGNKVFGNPARIIDY